MSGRLSATNLKDRTREYWEKSPGYDCYIEELLGRELEEAGRDSARLRGVGKPVHTLALTVGESFEPLLQLVCVLRPQRVVLILNAFYGNTPGEDKGRQLKRLMVKLAKVSNLPEHVRPALEDASFELRELQRDTPTQVFRALREAMQDPRALPPDGHTNVIDITGAKKSMVVGAFLFAAHSGIPITYVDFDEYDTNWCWFAGKLTVQIGNNSLVASSALNEPERSAAFKALVNYSSADAMWQALSRRRPLSLSRRPVQLATDSPSLSAYWQGTPLDFDAFTSENRSGFARLRGEAIHTHLCIPRPIAEAALKLVTAAVAEFERNWLEHFHPGTLAQAVGKSVAAPSWACLCKDLQLDFLPPRLRQ